MLITVTVKYINSILHQFYIISIRLGDMIYFIRTFTLLLRRMESVLTRSSLLRKSSVKFAPKFLHRMGSKACGIPLKFLTVK